MNENLLDIDHNHSGEAGSASSEGTNTQLYPLDWKDQDINLGKGRVVTVRRPAPQEILDRDGELQHEIPLGRDGGYALPDPTLNEAIDAKYLDLVKVEVVGYVGDMPEQHKATAFNALYSREIYVDDECDLLSTDLIPVIEEIGRGEDPDFTIIHWLRHPTEAEIKMYRRKSTGGQIKPGRRGRQTFVTSSNLRTAMSFYSQWLTKIEGASVGGTGWSEEEHASFVANVDPLIQRQVVAAVVEAYTAKLSD